jgi:hypothetical protein
MRSLILNFLIIVLITFITACGEKEQPENPKINNNTSELTSPQSHAATVDEKVDAGNYTYLNVTEDGKTFWIAVSKMDINVGEVVYFSKFMEMNEFKSETLDKTFESILFVDDASKQPIMGKPKSPHSNVATTRDGNINVEPLKNGLTVEQIYNQSNSIAKKKVKVKGVVTKVNENIMGTNWIHIQDGTGKEGSHDLLITSNETAKVGQTIIAEGTVVVNKDFGSGYFYSVLLEGSTISAQ